MQAHGNTLHWINCPNPVCTTKNIGSSATITQLLFSYRRIITADEAGVILVFSPDGELHYTLRGHRSSVWCLAATKTKLVSGSEDKTLRIWNLNTGLCTHVFRGHEGAVRCLQILKPEIPMQSDPELPPDRQPRVQPIRPLIVSGSKDQSVRIWMLPRITESEYGRHYSDGPPPNPDPDENPYHLYHLTGHTGYVRCVAANRTILLSGSDDCTVRVYNIRHDRLLYVLEGHTARITNVGIDPRLCIWYSTSMDGDIRLWDARDGACLATSTGHTAGITFMINTPWRIFSAGEDGLCITRNAASGTIAHVLHSGDGDCICDLRADDYKVLTCTEKSARMWTPQDGRMVRKLHQCVGKEKLSHVAYEFKQCALTYKDFQGYNMLKIIDFRPPEELQQWLGPSSELQDTDDEANTE